MNMILPLEQSSFQLLLLFSTEVKLHVKFHLSMSRSVSMNPESAPASFGTLAIIPGRIASSFIAEITSCCRATRPKSPSDLHENGHNQVILDRLTVFYQA